MVQKIHFMLSHYLFIRDLFLSLPELLSFHVFFFTFLYLHSIFFEQLVLFRPIVMGKLLSRNRLQSGLVPLNYLRQVKVNLLRRKIVFIWWAADAPSRNIFFFLLLQHISFAAKTIMCKNVSHRVQQELSLFWRWECRNNLF
jgi:hypothetical protein